MPTINTVNCPGFYYGTTMRAGNSKFSSAFAAIPVTWCVHGTTIGTVDGLLGWLDFVLRFAKSTWTAKRATLWAESWIGRDNWVTLGAFMPKPFTTGNTKAQAFCVLWITVGTYYFLLHSIDYSYPVPSRYYTFYRLYIIDTTYPVIYFHHNTIRQF